MRNGGYSIIDLSVTDNLYTNAVKAVNTEKPILVYGDDVPYFADSVTADDDAVTITKGGQTISIASDNAITKTGYKESFLLSSIVDDDGNSRFVEGDITTTAIDGVTYNYYKWSLSGSHLMIVLGFDITSGTVLTTGVSLGTVTLDSWLLNKIYALWGTTGVDVKTFTFIATGGVSETHPFYLSKTDTSLKIFPYNTSYTASADLSCRVQFDLLIDTD